MGTVAVPRSAGRHGRRIDADVAPLIVRWGRTAAAAAPIPAATAMRRGTGIVMNGGDEL